MILLGMHRTGRIQHPLLLGMYSLCAARCLVAIICLLLLQGKIGEFDNVLQTLTQVEEDWQVEDQKRSYY